MEAKAGGSQEIHISFKGAETCFRESEFFGSLLECTGVCNLFREAVLLSWLICIAGGVESETWVLLTV